MMVAQQFLLSCQSGLGIDGLIGYEQAMLNSVMAYQSLIDNRVGSVRGRPLLRVVVLPWNSSGLWVR